MRRNLRELWSLSAKISGLPESSGLSLPVDLALTAVLFAAQLPFAVLEARGLLR